jgi:hypothetical protein
LLLLPILAAADTFAPAKALRGEDNTVIVPLEISNSDGLMAMDIPLKYSEGVTLVDVTFENTRVDYFDMKLSKINEQERTVVIGLLHQMTPTMKPTLEAGSGAVANLVFRIDNPNVNELRLDPVVMKAPSHKLTYVYNTRTGENQYAHDETYPNFDGISVALSGFGEGNLPTSYSLEQNYPNPFNPSTEIGFALPAPGSVEIEVFNVLGQRVNTLFSGELPAGEHSVTWQGDDAEGRQVSSGVYFYRLTTDSDFTDTKKMLLVK